MGNEFATTIIRTRAIGWSVKIDVRFEIEKVRQHFKGFRQDQIPFSTSVAINECLKEAAPLVQREMQRVFDRPTAWTLNSYRVLKWSNKRDLVGIVGFKDAAGVTIKPGRKEGRFPGYPSDYLQPHMEGSSRNAKGLEVILREVGIIGPGEFLVPSKFQRLDQYGNVPRGIVQKVVANLRANRYDPYSQTPSGGARGGKKKADYYFTRRGIRGQRLTAIWQRFPSGNSIPAFIVVVGAPKYRKRFDQQAVVQQFVERNFESRFESAYGRAITSAR